jgi:hypothetical protein
MEALSYKGGGWCKQDNANHTSLLFDYIMEYS